MGYVEGVHAVSLSFSVVALSLRAKYYILIVMGFNDMEFNSKHVHINVLMIASQPSHIQYVQI